MESASATRPKPGSNPFETHCVVCDTPTPLRFEMDGRGREPVCPSFECQKIWRSKDSVSPHEYALKVDFQRRCLADRKLNIERKEKLTREIRQKEIQENRKLALKLQASSPFYSHRAKSLPIVGLPSGPVKTVNLSKKRRSAYRHFLCELISKGFSTTGDSTPLPLESTEPTPMRKYVQEHAELEKMNVQFCTICKGGCCTHGGNRAYLSVDTIRRIRLTNPAIRPMEILDVYMSSLQSKTIERSCINHTPGGCGLDREFRSDPCNRYFCDAMVTYAEDYVKRPDKVSGALVINRKMDHWKTDPEHSDNSVIATSIVEPGQIRIIDHDQDD